VLALWVVALLCWLGALALFLLEAIMAASRKSIALNNLSGANWSLGIVTEVKVLSDRVVVKLADGSFRQCVLKTAMAVRVMPSLTLDAIANSARGVVNQPCAFAAARYNGRDWSAEQWFVGVITADDYLAMRTENVDLSLPF
jgi:hypothetical protein